MVTYPVQVLALALVSLFLLGTAVNGQDTWQVLEANQVSGSHATDPAVWIAGTNVASFTACLDICKANATCKSCDYAADWSNYKEKCPAAGTCYIRSDNWWSTEPGNHCNHTSARRITPPPPPPVPHPPLGYQPNFVFILTDDQDTRLGSNVSAYTPLGSMEAMPILRKELIGEGTLLTNFFVNTPICW